MIQSNTKSSIGTGDGDIDESSTQGKRQPKTRAILTSEQLLELESLFEESTYPTRAMREALSSRLNISSRKIQVWFQNRRAKIRRNNYYRDKKVELQRKMGLLPPPPLLHHDKLINCNKSSSVVMPTPLLATSPLQRFCTAQCFATRFCSAPVQQASRKEVNCHCAFASSSHGSIPNYFKRYHPVPSSVMAHTIQTWPSVISYIHPPNSVISYSHSPDSVVSTTTSAL